MVSSSFICGFVEAADKVLKNAPHQLIRLDVGMKVDVAEARNHELEDVRLPHLLNFSFEFEVLAVPTNVRGEALHLADKVLFDVVGVALQLLEFERRVIVEEMPGGLVQNPNREPRR